MGRRAKLPTPQPVRLPVMEDKLIRDTRAATTMDILNRQGRQSTILSQMLKNLTGSIGFLGR